MTLYDHDSHLRVSRYVGENYSGLYMTREVPSWDPAYRKLYLSRLHSPDGPIVYVGIAQDGRLVDLTRAREVETCC